MDYDRYRSLPTGNICDSNNRLGALDPGLRPLDRTMKVMGPAYTVQCPPGDNLTIHKAMVEAKAGDVLVISCGGFLHAGCFGDLMGTACQVKGIAGAVIDGACRDKNELIEMGFPTFSRGVCPNGTTKENCGITGTAVICGGALVRTGDLVVGDCDGVVVIPREEAEGVLERALAKNQKEEQIRRQLLEGHSTAELFDLYPKFR